MSDGERKGSFRKRRRRVRDRRVRRGTGQGGSPPSGGKNAQGQQRRPADRGEPDRRGRSAQGRREGGGAGGRQPAREREGRLQYKSVILVPEAEAAPCPICGKPVRDVVAALAYGQERTPAHFDCVLESLRGGKELRPDEQLCYLGGGNFGVVRFARTEGSGPFSIRDRIQYEAAQERPQWRRDLDSVAKH
jgi:hypothetical protein